MPIQLNFISNWNKIQFERKNSTLFDEAYMKYKLTIYA